MVTFSDLIQTGILVVAIISLFVQVNKKQKEVTAPVPQLVRLLL